MTILCMTSKQTQPRLAFTFLADVRKRLYETYNSYELENAKAFALKTFTSELKDKMVSYNKLSSEIYQRIFYLNLIYPDDYDYYRITTIRTRSWPTIRPRRS